MSEILKLLFRIVFWLSFFLVIIASGYAKWFSMLCGMGPSFASATPGCRMAGYLLLPFLLFDFLGLIAGIVTLNFKIGIIVTAVSLLNVAICFKLGSY